MRSMTLTKHVRLLGTSLLAAAALFVALAALPSSSNSHGVLSQVAPPAAQAFEGGVSGDHVWMKVTAGDIAGGVTDAVCHRFAGPMAANVCPPIVQTVNDLIGGNSGVWVEIYYNGQFNAGTW